MVKSIYPQDAVKEELHNWIPVYIDIDELPKVAEQYKVTSLPTMIYLNADQTEINRTIGGISTVDKMVDLLKTKGGAKFEGGSRSPLLDKQLAALNKQIEESPEDAELRKQRIQLILDASLDSGKTDKLSVVGEDITSLSLLDSKAVATLKEEMQLYSMLNAIKVNPQFTDYYSGQFVKAFPTSERTGKLYAFLAHNSMKDARYSETAKHMKAYLQQFPKGGFVDEFNLLLPQIEDFLKLSEGVSFD